MVAMRPVTSMATPSWNRSLWCELAPAGAGRGIHMADLFMKRGILMRNGMVGPKRRWGACFMIVPEV